MRPALVALLLAGALLLGGAAPQFDAPAAGLASWYGAAHRGRHMADGHLFDERQATAASRTLPLGAVVRVCLLREPMRCTTVRVTDRGPYVGRRIIDLSEAAMRAIGGFEAGVVPVLVEPIDATR